MSEREVDNKLTLAGGRARGGRGNDDDDVATCSKNIEIESPNQWKTYLDFSDWRHWYQRHIALWRGHWDGGYEDDFTGMFTLNGYH